MRRVPRSKLGMRARVSSPASTNASSANRRCGISRRVVSPSPQQFTTDDSPASGEFSGQFPGKPQEYLCQVIEGKGRVYSSILTSSRLAKCSRQVTENSRAESKTSSMQRKRSREMTPNWKAGHLQIVEQLKLWWTSPGSDHQGVLIIRKLLILNKAKNAYTTGSVVRFLYGEPDSFPLEVPSKV